MSIPVAILGATGMVGQQYTRLLQEHPWFELSEIEEARLLFSCIGGPDVRAIEKKYAESGKHIVSNTSAHRRDPDIPVIIPEINPEHLQVIEQQRWPGSIVCKPNCSLQSYLLPLASLPFDQILVTTLQALSGAGKGVQMEKNIIPFIDGEEEKSEWEPRKILGSVTRDGIRPDDSFAISAHCNRVPTLHGHMACVSVSLKKETSAEQIREIWEQMPSLDLPSAPAKSILYFEEPDRPQPQQDLGDGMSISVGRLRSCPVLDHRFVALSHNLIRGAAGGGILTAELMVQQGYVS